MGFWIAVWRRLRTWVAMAALCAMMMYGYYLAGDREVEAIFRGFLGTAMVGGPWLAVLLVLEWITRSAESRREDRERADGDRFGGTRAVAVPQQSAATPEPEDVAERP